MDAGPLADRLQARLGLMRQDRIVERIWERDPTVWAPDPATPELADRLGWLSLPETMQQHVTDLTDFAADARACLERVVLCGMGGSSLAPAVMWRIVEKQDGHPSLHLLDSTHPAAVLAASSAPAATLYVIASKSGTTIETRSFERYLWDASGCDGSRFIAVTDPDTPLAREAEKRGYARVFINPPDVGGRFSALSLFGLVPAALVGIDIAGLLRRGAASAGRCAEQLGEGNVYAGVGAFIGEAALAGRDKLTFLLSPSLASFGLWLEQLIAESTGKQERGILPVVGERRAAPDQYGDDRAFVRIILRGDEDTTNEVLARRLTGLGLPVLEIELADRLELAGAMFGWEFATAIAGYVLGVNPFDQPDVAESKTNTARALTLGARRSVDADAETLHRWERGVGKGDYVGVMAYLPPSPETDARLEAVAVRLRERLGVVVTTGYGPRYLHSTGQLHKGGPPIGHFLQIVDSARGDLPVPGMSGFGVLISAQADGDLLALETRGRPVVRVRDWELLATELGI